MPKTKPKQWPSRVALVGDLRVYNWRKHFDSPSPLDVASLERKWVGPNTFRAFHNCPKKPSVVFRKWGETALTDRGFLDKLKSVRSRSSYDKWLTAFTKDFRDYWEREMRRPISFGPSLKLPNIIVKGYLPLDFSLTLHAQEPFGSCMFLSTAIRSRRSGNAWINPASRSELFQAMLPWDL
jgi:hypothetical protein